MTHIFVSHATADDGIVSKLHDELEDATKLDMWVDHKDLKPPEDNFRDALHNALKDCEAGLLVLSKNTIGRAEIVAEWNYILSTNRPLYIAKVDDIPIRDINPRLLIVQWVDLHANWEAGIRTLAAYMRGESAPADAPLVQTRKISGIDDRRLLNIPMSGRETELKAVLDKLKHGPVMIVGVGGRGKSRLASEVALKSTDSKGAVWHRVDDISSAEDVINGLREHFELANDAPRKDVLGKLKQEKTLVMIDNAESAEEDKRRADYCRLVETLLRAGAQVLLTGRAEWMEIDLLSVVRLEPITETATAVQILLDMGKVFQSPYDLTSEAETLAKAALMHPRLMEWAVKQTKREAPKDVLKQLQGLQSKDVQKALEDMIHKTLRQMTVAAGDDRAEKLLRQLVVFRGAFTMEAAEAVTRLDEDDLRTARNRLQEWQFLTMQATGTEARYRVDGLVLDVLTPSETARAAHFAYYNGLHGDHNTNNDEDRHPLIERDWENVRAALAWGFEHEAEAGCDMATALVYYMQFRVSYEIWRETLSKANQAAVKAGYTSGEAQTLQVLGDLDRMEAQYGNARANYEAALQAFRLIPSRLGEANTLKALGDLDYMEAQYGKARANYEAALQAFRLIPDRIGEANTLQALGDLDQAEKNWESAFTLYNQAIQQFQSLPDVYSEAITRRRMWPTLAALKKYEEAIKGVLFARDVYIRIGLNNYLNLVDNSMKSLREQIGEEAFMTAWRGALGDAPLPDWLG